MEVKPMRNDDIALLLADLIEVTASLEEEVAFLLKASPRDLQMEHMLGVDETQHVWHRQLQSLLAKVTALRKGLD
jgi:predicted AlkP superfamily phosphohydrolase/phosphomutase